MKRLVYLAMAALMALVILVPTAMAQEMMDESMMMDDSNMMDESMMEQPKMMDDSMMMEQPNSMEKGKMEMPMTGGPSLGLFFSRCDPRSPGCCNRKRCSLVDRKTE